MEVNIEKLRNDLKEELCADIHYFGYGQLCNNECDWCKSINKVFENSKPSDNSSSKKDCEMVSMPKFVFDMIIKRHPEVKEYYKCSPS